jgi:hypothetical protein
LLKKGRVHRKTYIESIFEKDTKELDLRKVYKYLGMEDSHDIEQKNEREDEEGILEEIEISLGHNLAQRIKYKQLDHWQYQYLHTVLEVLIGAKNN